jgi:co-chaperonin GroES (HSP10)
MAKKKLEIEVPDLYVPAMASVEQTGKVPPFTKVEPVGNQVLIERFFESELVKSNLALAGSNKPSNQAVVLAIGPLVNKDLNIKVGNRVLLQGTFVPVPNDDPEAREKNLVLPDMIKAVLS